MAKNDNAHSVRLVDSLDRNAGHDTVKEFEKKYPYTEDTKSYEHLCLHRQV